MSDILSRFLFWSIFSYFQIIQKFIADVYKARTGNDISDDFQNLLWSLIVSVFAIGGMIGGMIGGSIANKFGR